MGGSRGQGEGGVEAVLAWESPSTLHNPYITKSCNRPRPESKPEKQETFADSITVHGPILTICGIDRVRNLAKIGELALEEGKGHG